MGLADVPIPHGMIVVSAWRMPDGIAIIYDNAPNGDPQPIGILLLGKTQGGLKVNVRNREEAIKACRIHLRQILGHHTQELVLNKPFEKCWSDLATLGFRFTLESELLPGKEAALGAPVKR